METFNKFFEWLKTLPVWLRAVALILIAALMLVFTLSSCGVTRASVLNRAEGTSTEIKITTSNPTTVTATPNVNLDTNGLK